MCLPRMKIKILRYYCQNPNLTSIQVQTTLTAVRFDTIMTVHTTTNFTTRNSSPALERLQGRVNQRNLRQSSQTILGNYSLTILDYQKPLSRLFSETILDHVRQLTQTILGNHLILYQATIFDYLMKLSQTSFGNYHRLSQETILYCLRHLLQTI